MTISLSDLELSIQRAIRSLYGTYDFFELMPKEAALKIVAAMEILRQAIDYKVEINNDDEKDGA